MRSITHLLHTKIREEIEKTQNSIVPRSYYLASHPYFTLTITTQFPHSSFPPVLQNSEQIKLLHEHKTKSRAATTATMAMLNAKCLTGSSIPKLSNPIKPTTKPISLLSIQNLPKDLITSMKPSEIPSLSSSITGTAIAGTIFSTLTTCDAAFAAQQITEIAEGDNRGLALLLPIIPAIAWVLFNILQPALNQINRMRNKGVIIGVGLSGLASSGLWWSTPHALATEIAVISDAAASGDNRGQLLLFVVAPAIAWVLFNILQPALNQINRMRSK
ncbi:Photosystem ii core complex proteins psby, chloroplastic [Quillaja saponaria]|uniref:Photosystem ii core complex proteins psby, chloroplastic n=1 Tax=Quillaja saponaria TaxID=32244 RepID=A0AAD7KTE4_QUISA|nr:Photosystem ii core complex proteins psby, chloroplastic [Quillaja saponaria]